MSGITPVQQATLDAADVVKNAITATSSLVKKMATEAGDPAYDVDGYAADVAQGWSIAVECGLGLLGAAAHLAQPTPKTYPVPTTNPVPVFVDVVVTIAPATGDRDLALAAPFAPPGGGAAAIPADRVTFLPTPVLADQAGEFTVRVDRTGIAPFFYSGTVRVGPPGTQPVPVDLLLS
jgi:hypothetical protein